MAAPTQALPPWMEYTTYTADGQRTTGIVQLPLTYTGASVPLGWPWVQAGSNDRRVSLIGGEGYQYRDDSPPTSIANLAIIPTQSSLGTAQQTQPSTQRVPATLVEQVEESTALPFPSLVTLPNGQTATLTSPVLAFTSTDQNGVVVTSTAQPLSRSTTAAESSSMLTSNIPSSISNALPEASVESQKRENGLSGGQIAGISLGSVLAAALLLGAFLVWCCVRRKQRLRGDDASWVGISNTPQMQSAGVMPYLDGAGSAPDEPPSATTGSSTSTHASQYAGPYHSTRYDDQDPPPSGGAYTANSGSNRSNYTRDTETTIDEDTLFYSLPASRVPSRSHAVMRAPHLSNTYEEPEAESLLETNPFRDSIGSEDLMALSSPEPDIIQRERFSDQPRPAPTVPVQEAFEDADTENEDTLQMSQKSGIPLVSTTSRVIGNYLGGIGIGNLILGNRKPSGESQMSVVTGERRESFEKFRDDADALPKSNTARPLSPRAAKRLTAVGYEDSPTLGISSDESQEETDGEDVSFLPYQKIDKARWSKTTLGRKVPSQDSSYTDAHSFVASLRSTSHDGSQKHSNRSQNSSFGSRHTRRSISESGALSSGKNKRRRGSRSGSSSGHASRHTNRSDPSSTEMYALPALHKT